MGHRLVARREGGADAAGRVAGSHGRRPVGGLASGGDLRPTARRRPQQPAPARLLAGRRPRHVDTVPGPGAALPAAALCAAAAGPVGVPSLAARRPRGAGGGHPHRAARGGGAVLARRPGAPRRQGLSRVFHCRLRVATGGGGGARQGRCAADQSVLHRRSAPLLLAAAPGHGGDLPQHALRSRRPAARQLGHRRRGVRGVSVRTGALVRAPAVGGGARRRRRPPVHQLRRPVHPRHVQVVARPAGAGPRSEHRRGGALVPAGHADRRPAARAVLPAPSRHRLRDGVSRHIGHHRPHPPLRSRGDGHWRRPAGAQHHDQLVRGADADERRRTVGSLLGAAVARVVARDGARHRGRAALDAGGGDRHRASVRGHQWQPQHRQVRRQSTGVPPGGGGHAPQFRSRHRAHGDCRAGVLADA